MSIEEAAQELGLHPETISDMIKRGELQGSDNSVDDLSVDQLRNEVYGWAITTAAN